MEMNEILRNLCSYDKRHPLYKDLYLDDWVDIREPRNNCFCDNCFYGRDKLALEILRLSHVSI